MPFKATAGILSSLSSVFGNNTSAYTNSFSFISETSQNMNLLEPSGSFSLVLNEKNKEVEKGQNEDVLISNDALVPIQGPFSVKNTGLGGGSSEGISVYVVREDDTISQIAEMFEVTQNTILWANNMKRTDKIKEGDVLLILPVSGVEHTVKKGETIKGIANKYKVEVEEILWYNGLKEDMKLSIGDKLIVPGAELPGSVQGSSPTSSRSAIRSASMLSQKPIVGYYINPIPQECFDREACRRTQKITSTHHGVDIGGPTGTVIRASASGKVTLARTGYNGGYGTLVIIKHPNGTETLYAHMSKLGTTTGAEVKQGEVIGYVGSTGRSTGPHLHFEVKGAYNPGQDWSWAK